MGPRLRHRLEDGQEEHAGLIVAAPLTRRQLLARAGAAGLLAGGPRLLWPGPAAASGAAGLRKGISGGNHNLDPAHGGPNDLLLRLPDGTQPNLADTVAAGATWLKVWVSWTDVQAAARPVSRAASWAQLDAFRGPDGRPWAHTLDETIAAANRAGVRVILTLYQSYPTWAGTPPAGSAAPDGSETGSGRARATLVPDDVGVDSPWGWFVAWLMARYARPPAAGGLGSLVAGPAVGNFAGAHADLFEVVNEPNLLLWPQAGLAAKVAAMLRSADALAVATGFPGVLGPALHDGDADPARGVTGYREFTGAVLDALAGWSPAGYVGWSMHTYVEVARGTAWPESRVGWVQAQLASRGWQSALGASPRPIFVTETGYAPRVDATDPVSSARELVRQDVLCRQNFVMLRDRPSGAYVWMQHLWNDYPHPGVRAHWGLREACVYGPGGVVALGAPRPFSSTFRALPTGVSVPAAGVPVWG